MSKTLLFSFLFCIFSFHFINAEAAIVKTKDYQAVYESTGPKYHVLLATFEKDVPFNYMNIFFKIGGVQPVQNADGSSSYYSPAFNTQAECTSAMNGYKTKYGLSNMSVVIVEDGVIRSVE